MSVRDLSDLFGDQAPTSSDRVQGILDLLPKYFLAAFVSRDADVRSAGTRL